MGRHQVEDARRHVVFAAVPFQRRRDRFGHVISFLRAGGGLVMLVVLSAAASGRLRHRRGDSPLASRACCASQPGKQANAYGTMPISQAASSTPKTVPISSPWMLT